MPRSFIYCLTIGDESSSGPVFPAEAEALTAGQAAADEGAVEVTLFRAEVEGPEGHGDFVSVEELCVLRPRPA